MVHFLSQISNIILNTLSFYLCGSHSDEVKIDFYFSKLLKLLITGTGAVMGSIPLWLCFLFWPVPLKSFLFPDEHQLSSIHQPGKDKAIEGSSPIQWFYYIHWATPSSPFFHHLLFPDNLAPRQNSTPTGCNSSAPLQPFSCSLLQSHMLLALTFSIFQHSQHETMCTWLALWGASDQWEELALNQRGERTVKIQLAHVP